MAVGAGQRWFETRSACPVCSSERFRVIYSQPFNADPIRRYLVDSYAAVGGAVEFEYLEGASYTLCDCPGCGLIFQQQVPNGELMERLYEHWIDPRGAFDRHLAGDSLGHYAEYAQDIMSLLGYLAKAPATVSMLDFGMGWGRWATMAKAFGCNAFGSELSAARVDFARSNGITIVDWDSIPGHGFDVINADQVFEHVSTPLELLNHLKLGLAPDGVIKIDVPRPANIERRLGAMDWTAGRDTTNSLNDVAPLEHINCFRRSSLDELGRQAGLQQVFIPVREQLQHLTGMTSLKGVAAQVVRPFYRSWMKKGSVVYFRHRRTAPRASPRPG